MRWASIGLDITPTNSDPCNTMYNMSLFIFPTQFVCSHSNTHTRTQLSRLQLQCSNAPSFVVTLHHFASCCGTPPQPRKHDRLPPRERPLATPSSPTRPKQSCLTPGSTPASLWYTHIGLACCMVVVAFFAPRRFSAHRSEKRLVWRR